MRLDDATFDRIMVANVRGPFACIRALASRYTDTVTLFQALGGGWWNRNDVAATERGNSDRVIKDVKY